MVDIVSVTNVLGLAGGLREQGTWLVRSVRRIATRSKDQAPGDWDTRKVAYDRFGVAAIGLAQDIQLLATMGTPPKVRGAIWTWPTVLRVNQRSYDRFNEVLNALLEIALIGEQAVVDAGAMAAEALGTLAARLPAGRGGADLPPDFSEQVEVVTDKVGDFVAAARSDLGNKD